MKITLISFLLLVSAKLSAQADTVIMLRHLRALTETDSARNYRHEEILQDVASYLHNETVGFADTVTFQAYTIGSRVYTNVIASFGTEHTERIVVGAHYDVCGEQQGADDNATGVTGLLELARLLKGQKLSKRIDLVFYTLEEPPFYDSEAMGSVIHAQSMIDEKADVKGMICLEMIGYFSDEKNSQSYPLGFLKWIYGSRGNYITLVNKLSAGSFARKFTRSFKNKSTVEAKQFKAPKSLTGVGFSDHRSYWERGFSAVMVTDTSFYRNANYHTSGDTVDKLDLQRMAEVIDAVFLSLDVY